MQIDGEMGMNKIMIDLVDLEYALEKAETYAEMEGKNRAYVKGIRQAKKIALSMKDESLEDQEESVPLKPLCRWLSHYATCPTKTGEQPPTNIEMVRAGWEHWFRNGFKEWLRMGKPE